MKIIISIPAKDEEKSIGAVIKEIQTAMHGYDYQILVLNDGSTDMTAEVAKEHGAIVYSHQVNKGLAKTFNSEMKYCLKHNADIIIHFDADGQYVAAEIPKLLREIANGYDLVLGSRFEGYIEEMHWLKRFGNKAFSKVISHLTKLKITDAQTGFRAFTKEVAELKINSSFSYTQEQIIKAVRNNFFIKEVPVTFRKREGKSRLMKSPIDYAIKAWINILRLYRDYEPLKFFFFISLLFLVPGLILGCIFLYWYFTTGQVYSRIPLVILDAVLLLGGFQILLFGFIVDKNEQT